MGIEIHGLFIEMATYTDKDGKVTFCVYAACGRSSYGIYMDEKFSPSDLEGVKTGSSIVLAARPYVDKNGKLRWTGGEVLSVG